MGAPPLETLPSEHSAVAAGRPSQALAGGPGLRSASGHRPSVGPAGTPASGRRDSGSLPGSHVARRADLRVSPTRGRKRSPVGCSVHPHNISQWKRHSHFTESCSDIPPLLYCDSVDLYMPDGSPWWDFIHTSWIYNSSLEGRSDTIAPCLLLLNVLQFFT